MSGTLEHSVISNSMQTNQLGVLEADLIPLQLSDLEKDLKYNPLGATLFFVHCQLPTFSALGISSKEYKETFISEKQTAL